MNRFLKTLGPGILFASTAIGVSHLVQSTRAGAEYGLGLLLFIIAANVFKFPFFEFGSRYASVTGKHLIAGYAKLGKGVLLGYIAITLLTMFFVTAAVTSVSAGFMQNLFGSNYFQQPWAASILLLSACALVLIVGKFAALDSLIKGIALTLLITTVIAFIAVLWNGPEHMQTVSIKPIIPTSQSLPFIIALMGWMPTAVDLSTWNSMWTLERIKNAGFKPTLSETLREFNLGYWMSAGLSICFVVLGAFLLYEGPASLPDQSAGFASGVIRLYTETIGAWSYPVMAIAGFSVMLGTTFGVLDGYARSAEAAYSQLFKTRSSHYSLWVILTAMGSAVVLVFFSGQLNALVDLATTLSFVVAPFVAIANYVLIFGKTFPQRGRPKWPMQVLSLAGILFLLGFGLVFLFWKF